MEFRPSLNTTPPKNLYPCLATITLGPASDKSGRRLSGSAVSDEEGGLKRVISGGRRKTSFGQVADRGDIRRSVDGGAGVGGVGGAGSRKSFEGAGQVEKGTWYWRVQAGVNDTHLVLLPLSQPANPLLTSAPAPLSEVMPSHSTAHSPAGTAGGGGSGESLGTKMKNLLTGRRHSKATADDTSADTDTTAVNPPREERILDQTGGGEMLPSASANAIGANNGNANAETGWPGVVGGEKLAAVIVSLSSIDQSGVKLHEHKKESTYVTVPITAHLAGVGQTNELAPKSGFIKFEFDKDWIGAKGEAELLHHYITSAAQNPPAPASHFANQNFQLGGSGGNAGVVGGSPRTANAGGLPPVSTDVAPDQSVSTASSGKVAGTV